MSNHPIVPGGARASVVKPNSSTQKERAQLQAALEQLEALLEAGVSEGNLAEVERITRLIEKARAALAKGSPRSLIKPGSPPPARRDDIQVGGPVGPGAAVGDGQVVAGQIFGGNRIDHPSIYIQNIESFQGNGIEFEFPDKAGQASGVERAYLLKILASARRVPLGQLELHVHGSQDHTPEIRLDHIYVPLDTSLTQPAVGDNQGGARVPVPMLSAAIRDRRLVILGDPGSGKTTFINYLTLVLAHACLDSKAGVLERLNVPGINGQRAAQWKYGALLPVRIDLREFAQDIPENTRKGTCDLVWQHILSWLSAASLSEFADPLKKALRDGKCLVMFDGLDEVSDPARRKIVRDSVTQFADTYQQSRFIVTCRVLSYTDPAWQLTSFPAVTLAPLSQTSIHCFIDSWYATLSRLGVLDRKRAAQRAVELRSAAQHLSDLAQNPMLLTVMAVVHTYKGTLPRERARLYNDCVELMLWHWQRHKQSSSGNWELGILQELETREERLVNGLCEVAYHAHLSQGAGLGPAHIAEGEVVRILRRYLDNNWDKAQHFCDYVEGQAGLLIGKGGDVNGERVYAFPHRGFQEFLAARHLVSGWDFARRVADLAEKGDVWREVLMLAVGHLVFNQQEVVPRPLDAMNLLCKQDPPTTDAGWRAIWWAGEMLHIVGRAAAEQDEHVGKALVPRLITQLSMLVSQGHLSARERAQAADVLGLLGDPRPGVSTVVPEMVMIPGGKVDIGADAERHSVTLRTYALSRYPITNAQFRVFVEDAYHKREFWTEAGWAWREKTGPRRGLLDDPVWGIDNRPAVAITWYEAVAYARWLAARSGRPFRLPTEAEWERAAAGIERRKYPWGSRTSDETANHRDTGLGQSTSVGMFAQDCTPEGIFDMGGNVWEWCSSLGMDYPYRADDGREDLNAPGPRMLRGGAFDNPRNVLHCTHRRPAEPRARVALIGFRVALSEK